MFDFDKYCLNGEEWKQIPTFYGYEASNLGRIRTVEGKKTFTEHHGIRVWKGKILKNKTKVPSKSGYVVSIWKEGKPYDLLVSRLVCSAFYGMPEDFLEKMSVNKITVNHKDGNRYNNNFENLEWMSIKENIQHGFENDLYLKNQKPIMLISKGIVTHFKSLSEASRYLDKNNGYLGGQIKRGQNVYDKFGNRIEVYESIRLI